MRRKTSIGIIEDHDMFRESLIRVLKDQNDLKIVFEAGTSNELFNKIQDKKTDIVILDYVIPGEDGKKVIEKLKANYPETKILVVSGHTDDDLIVKLVKLGIDSFLPKDRGIKSLIEALNGVKTNGHFFEESVLKLLDLEVSLSHGDRNTLNAREKMLLMLFCQEKSHKEIEQETGLKYTNIGYYKNRIMRKTGAKDNAELREYALKNRYIK